MKSPLSQDVDVLNALKSATQTIGFDLQDAVIGLGLPPDLLKSPDQFVPSQLFNCLLESIARDYHCHDIALKVAQNLHSPQLGLPARVMELSPNLRIALDKATQYGAFYRDTCPWQHQVSDSEVAIYKLNTDIGSQHLRQRSVLGTAQMYLLLRKLSGNNWHPHRVSFSSPDPGARFSDTYKDFFNCEIDFDQPINAVHFSEHYLDYSIATSNNTLLQTIEHHIQGLQRELTKDGDLITKAKLIINQRLNFGYCSINELTHDLSTTKELLLDELHSHGLNFESLMEQQISEKANYYLTEFHAPTELILSSLMPQNEPRLNDLLTEKIATQHQW